MEENLKIMLRERGWSVAGFAREVGIPQPTMHRIVNGSVKHSSVTVGNYIKIAHGLGLTVEELYFDDPHMASEKTEIDRAYLKTSREGRRAMIANARGVLKSYPLQNTSCLPPWDGGLRDMPPQ